MLISVEDRSKNTKKKGNDTYDPAEPTEDEVKLQCFLENLKGGL